MTNGTHKWCVTYQRPIHYEIVDAPNLFDPHNHALLSVGRVENSRRFIVVDSNVERYYADEIRTYFAYHRVDAKIVPFAGGEDNKTIESYLSIARELDAFPIHRRDEPIIAIGGGVLTDVVGFVAGSYRRSVPHIKVPTTLMGYIDASVGIKTGINFDGHKNRLGSFEPPLRVFLDRSFLRTLPRRHILNGVCEIIKLAVIKDVELFGLLEHYGPDSVAAHFQNGIGGRILDRAISGMIDELQPNLFEDNLARSVDFGHTFSYGFETCCDADLLHGEAVLLDIAVSVLIARERNLVSDEESCRFFQLISRLDIPLNLTVLDPCLLWQSLEERVYHRNGLQRVPMPKGIGNCVFINDVRLEEIQLAIDMLKYEVALSES